MFPVSDEHHLELLSNIKVNSYVLVHLLKVRTFGYIYIHICTWFAKVITVFIINKITNHILGKLYVLVNTDIENRSDCLYTAHHFFN